MVVVEGKPKKSEIKNSMWLTIFVMKHLGGLPPKNSEWRNIYWCYGIFIQVFFGYAFIISQFVNIFLVDDPNIIADSLNMLVEQTACLAKSFFLLYNTNLCLNRIMNGNKANFNSLMARMLETLESDLFNSYTKDQQNLITKNVSGIKKITYGYFSGVTFCCTLLALTPILQHVHALPYPGWFPFKTEHSPVFEITYIWQAISVPIIGYFNSSIDLSIASLLAIACSQYDVLSDTFQNIYQVTLKKKLKNSNLRAIEIFDPELDKDIYAEIVKCIKHHNLLFSFLKDFENTFKYALLAQFSGSILVLCVNTFLLSKIQSITDPKLFGLLPFQIVILSQIYLYCWFGNKVFYKSTQFIHSVYMLEWDKCSKKIRQTLCIIMDRSRRPININAGNLIPVRLDTFIQIVKSAYSMFAILQNMDNEIEN